MEDQRPQRQSIQAVFLIDTLQFHENRGNEKLLNNAFRATGISVLRLLTYLANRVDCDKTKFAWGCQFFRIPLKTHFYSKRSVFREFTRSTFSDFEKQLKDEINVDDIGKPNQKLKQKHGAGDEISPAFSLKYALHDASLEYRWDELVISSPVKSAYMRKRKKTKLQELPPCVQEQQQTKFVFVLLPCPRTLNELEKFTEDKSQCNPSVLKRTLIHIGKQESSLFDHHKASLFWIDTRNVWRERSTKLVEGSTDIEDTVYRNEVHIQDHKGFNLINEALALVRGSVIPLECLTNSGATIITNVRQLLQIAEKVPSIPEQDAGSPQTSAQKSVHGKKQKGAFSSEVAVTTASDVKSSRLEENGAQRSPSKSVLATLNAVCKPENSATASGSLHSLSTALPYTSCLDHFTQNKLSKSAHPSWFGTTQEITIELHESIDEAGPVMCHLKLQLLWKSSASTRLQSSSEGGSSCNDKLVTTISDGVINIPVYPAVSSESALVADSATVNPSDASKDQTKGNLQGFILAAVPRDLLTLDLYQASEVFSCLGYDVTRDEAESERASVWFEKVLGQLAQKNCLMVLQVFDRFAVLEPLTPVMGSLRVIDSRRLMAIERIVAFDGTSVRDLGEGKPDPGARTMMRLNREIRKADRTKRGTGPSRSTQLDLDIHHQTKSLKPFSSSCFEPWYQDLPQRGVTAKFLEQLVRLPENVLVDDSVNLDSALSQLKSLYRSGSNMPQVQEKKNEEEKSDVKENVKPEAKFSRQESKIIRKLTARTRSILENSRRVETQTPQDSPKQKKVKKKENNQVFIPDKDFSSIDDLQTYVSEAYNSAIENATNHLSCAQQIVFLTVHFMKEQTKDDSDDNVPSTVKEFLHNSLLKSNADLIKKYQNPLAELEPETRVKEAQLQSLLRFEVEMAFPSEVKLGDQKVKGQPKSGQDEESDQSVFDSSADDTDSELPEEVQDIVDEVSQLLSSIPLILADHDELLSFLHDIVLPSYSDTIPYMVKAVFEQLGQPVPNELMSPASSKPSVKPPLSYNSLRSWGSVDAAPSSSTRSRTLSRHPSLADASHSRIIPIQQPRRAKTKKLPTKKEEPDEAKRAKRNLFSDEGGSKLVRRESVAVMEGISKPRRQSPRKHPQVPPRVLKTRRVKETPGKRQVSQAVLCSVNRARKLEERFLGKPLAPTIEVIEESPVKPLTMSAPRNFPRHLTKNLSFYSQDKTKTAKEKVQEARRLTARINGSSPDAAQDIAKKVQLMKSPARTFLKEVCTPSTLGSLSRLRSGHVTIGGEASPELKAAKGEKEQKSPFDSPKSGLLLSPKRITRSAQKQTPLKEIDREIESASNVAKSEKRLPAITTKSAPSRSAQKMTPLKQVGVVPEHPIDAPRSEQLMSPKGKTRSAKKLTNEGVKSSTGESTNSSDSNTESGDSTNQETMAQSAGKGTPRKRKSLRTSLKTMFDGVASADQVTTNRKKRKLEQEENKEPEKDSKTYNHHMMADDENSLKREAKMTEGTGTKMVESEDTSGPASSYGSPMRKRRRTSGELKTKVTPKQCNPKSGTPSPRRKTPKVLASPEIFQQWPRRKLRSTPSPNSHFVRGISKRPKREASVSESTKSPKNLGKGLERSLRKRSKTCLKFPALDPVDGKGSEMGEEVTPMKVLAEEGEMIEESNQLRQGMIIDGQCAAMGMTTKGLQEQDVVKKGDSRSLQLKRETSAEELERHFSFHSDDDEIEFVKINRSLSKDSFGRDIPQEDNNEGSPVFSGSSSDMRSPGGLQSPFRSPRANTRNRGMSAGPKATSGSPVFNYVSTPNSSGMKLTFRRCPSSLRKADVVPSSVSSGEYPSMENSIPGQEGASLIASENDGVFASLCEEGVNPRSESTPPGSSRKVNCNLSTKGLYGLLHSPFAGSPGQRLSARKSLPVSRRNSHSKKV